MTKQEIKKLALETSKKITLLSNEVRKIYDEVENVVDEKILQHEDTDFIKILLAVKNEINKDEKGILWHFNHTKSLVEIITNQAKPFQPIEGGGAFLYRRKIKNEK